MPDSNFTYVYRLPSLSSRIRSAMAEMLARRMLFPRYSAVLHFDADAKTLADRLARIVEPKRTWFWVFAYHNHLAGEVSEDGFRVQAEEELNHRSSLSGKFIPTADGTAVQLKDEHIGPIHVVEAILILGLGICGAAELMRWITHTPNGPFRWATAGILLLIMTFLQLKYWTAILPLSQEVQKILAGELESFGTSQPSILGRALTDAGDPTR